MTGGDVVGGEVVGGEVVLVRGTVVGAEVVLVAVALGSLVPVAGAVAEVEVVPDPEGGAEPEQLASASDVRAAAEANASGANRGRCAMLRHEPMPLTILRPGATYQGQRSCSRRPTLTLAAAAPG